MDLRVTTELLTILKAVRKYKQVNKEPANPADKELFKNIKIGYSFTTYEY